MNGIIKFRTLRKRFFYFPFFFLSEVGFSSGVAAQLIEALSEAEDLDQLDASWQVKQLISEAKGFLKQMIR